MPTLSLSRPPASSFVCSKKHGSSIKTGSALFHCTSCRLRYFGALKTWSMAYYTYSNERYEPCTFANGTFYGTPEEAFEVGAVYLRAR